MQQRMSVIAVSAVIVVTLGALASCTPKSDSPPEATSDATTTSSAPASPSTEAPAARAVALTPVIGSVLAAPIPVPATDGKLHLAYELQLTNTLPQPVTLSSLLVVAGDKTLKTYSGSELAYWTRVIGDKGTPTTTLGGSQTAVIWLDVTVDDRSAVPVDISHRISLTVPTPQLPILPPSLTANVAPTTVDSREPVVISTPLAGPNWLDGNGCCEMTPHRTAVNPLNGQLWVAERFAIDFVQLTADGKLFNGADTRLESYPYFGVDVLAVADGPVVAVVKDLPEQPPGVNPTGLPLNQFGGNHVVQDIGGGNFAFYAHMKTGSVKVNVGDRLTTGQPIGALGNTGNTSAPHLHFHVMSTPDPLVSNGLPFMFNKFKLDSRIASNTALDALINTGGPAQLQPGLAAADKTNVMPLILDVMTNPSE